MILNKMISDLKSNEALREIHLVFGTYLGPIVGAVAAGVVALLVASMGGSSQNGRASAAAASPATAAPHITAGHVTAERTDAASKPLDDAPRAPVTMVADHGAVQVMAGHDVIGAVAENDDPSRR